MERNFQSTRHSLSLLQPATPRKSRSLIDYHQATLQKRGLKQTDGQRPNTPTRIHLNVVGRARRDRSG
jgi:hypothetical protein